MNDPDTHFVADDDVCKYSDDEEILTSPSAVIYHNEQSEDQSLFWKRGNPRPSTKKECLYNGAVKLDLSENPTPYKIFEQVSNIDELVSLIVHQSELYAEQSGRVFVTEEDEIKAFIGCNYIMLLYKLPSLRCYWKQDACYSNKLIVDTFQRDRFLEIIKNIHFANNNRPKVAARGDMADRAWKIRPVMEHFNHSFQSAKEPEPEMSIDEHMVKFKGRSFMKQYIRNKPIKWGFKIWCRCASTTGYLYEFDIYTGKNASQSEPLGESVVWQLSKALKGSNVSMYFDNFFTSPSLLSKLLKYGIYGTGTVQPSRKGFPRNMHPADNSMARGEVSFAYSNELLYFKWKDSKGITMLTNDTSKSKETTSVSRWSKASKERIKVSCPVILAEYNKFMGGVDIMDQMKSYYELDRRSRSRFYIRIFYDLLDIAVVTAFRIYQQLELPEMSLHDFKDCVAKSLVSRYSSRIRVAVTKGITNVASVANHLPVFLETRIRCKLCSVNGTQSRTSIKCHTCDVALCLSKERNCFYHYHK